MFFKLLKKSLIQCLLIIAIILVIAACSDDKENESNNEQEEIETSLPIAKDEGNLDKPENNNKVDEELEEEPTSNEADLLEIAPEEPTNLDEILDYPTGPLAGNGDFRGKEPVLDEKELASYVMDVLPPIEDDNEDEAYLDKWWRAFRYLFAEDYPDPRQGIAKMKLANFGNPGIEDERFHLKDQMNVLVILDVSGSMADEINGKSMMDIAKDSIYDFTSDLPEEANIGLRVYGHEGARTGKTKEESCQITELVYDIQPIDATELQTVIDPFEPTGWTPVGLSLQQAKEDFADFPGEENTNLVYIVSDGAETCGGDPAAAAKELAESDIQSIVNVIGFNVDIEGQSHLREIAEAGGGIYTDAGDEEQLQEAFDQAEEIINQWKEWKRGARADVNNIKDEQEIEVMNFDSDAIWLNNDEFFVKKSTLKELRNQNYITESASDYFEKRNLSYDELFKDIRHQAYDDFMEEIEITTEELLEKIEAEYNRNIEE